MWLFTTVGFFSVVQKPGGLDLEDGSRLWFTRHGMYKHQPKLEAV